MAFSFQNFFFGQLPIYYKVKDTYKDNNDRGLLERYLEIFGLELDEELIPLVDNYLNIVSPLDLPDPKYLTTLGYTLGSPPDLLIGQPDSYAKLLAYIINIYKIKGTARSYELLFALLGFNVTIIELTPQAPIYMDEGNIMDDDLIMDISCPSCSEYEVIVSPLLTNPTLTCQAPTYATVDNTILAQFIRIIEFLQPINAQLVGLVNGGLLCETVDLCIHNEVQINVIELTTFDISLTLDNSETMDTESTVSATPFNFDCTGPLNTIPLQTEDDINFTTEDGNNFYTE